MSSSGERQEVAKELVYGGVDFPPEVTYLTENGKFMSSSAFYMGNRVLEALTAAECEGRSWEDANRSLADLIDPTTTAHEDQPDELCCDKCGETFGRYTYGCDGREVRYCPACGRRITAIRDFGNSTQYELVAEEEGE